MSEKKAKEARREANTIEAEYLIRLYAGGRLEIRGNLDNFFLFRDVMNGAERIVLDRISKQLQAARGNIIVPGIVPPKDIKGADA